MLTYAAAPATPAGGVGLAARGRRSLARRIDAALGAPVTGRGLGPVAWLVLAGWTALALAGARPAAARHPASELCLYSPQIALELLASFPVADRDGSRPVEVFFKGFGASSIDLDVRFWVDYGADPGAFLRARSHAVMRSSRSVPML